MSLDEKIAQVHGIQDKEHYRFVPGLARLGIPAFQVTNGPAGVGPGGAGSQLRATAFPAPIALAATWDGEAAKTYGRLAAQESMALGNNMLESPDINIARVPQGGRVFESFGEDPFLTSMLTVASIEGIQSTGEIANVKHFLANNQETDRGTINELIAERPLREIYMPAFEAAVREAHVASVMCAYPRVNGSYNCENEATLLRTLKDDWHFDGFVSSDFGAVHSTIASAKNGLDLELPTGLYFDAALKKAILSGAIRESRLDDMVSRRIAKMIELGQFGDTKKPASIPILEDGAMSRKIAEESMVLLKNDGALLPLDPLMIHSVALLGPYAMRALTGGGGSSHVIPLYTIQPVDGMDAALPSQTKIKLLDGADIDAAVEAARTSDIAIVMVGDDEGEDHDHAIELPAPQNKLIEAVAKANPKTVVVIKSGSAVLMPWLSSVPAVLEAWYPGEEDGNAVADVLFGKTNPSGKLPLTFPIRAEDTLAANADQYPGDGTTVHYSEGLAIGYRGYQAKAVKPLFPFGFGLSYTSFQFTGLSITSKDDGAEIHFQVTNTGKRSGAEVAQLYLTFPGIDEGEEPGTPLKGFQRISLTPGESKAISISLNTRALSYWSGRSHSWLLARGTYLVAVGESSSNVALTGSFTIH